jgi:hypothetical protein
MNSESKPDKKSFKFKKRDFLPLVGWGKYQKRSLEAISEAIDTGSLKEDYIEDYLTQLERLETYNIMVGLIIASATYALLK